MLLEEQEILNLALSTLRNKLSLTEDELIHEENMSNLRVDAFVQIMSVDFVCEIKNIVTTTGVVNLIRQLRVLAEKEQCPVLLVAKYISAGVVEVLASNGINTLDCAGNCNIRYENGDGVIIHLNNKGEKCVLGADNSYPAFREAGLRVIFYLLQDAINVNRSYREIHGATGVSLGAIKNVISALVDENFVIHVNGKRVLKNKNRLLNLWVENYNRVLKPKLLLAKMNFRSDEHRRTWYAMELPDGMYWGGEGGAYMVDRYLEPGAFEIYTDILVANLFKTGFVGQSDDGVIKVYRKFWTFETDSNLAPLVLIYADLVGSGNSRCLEMANKILDDELQDFK